MGMYSSWKVGRLVDDTDKQMDHDIVQLLLHQFVSKLAPSLDSITFIGGLVDGNGGAAM